MKDRKPQTEGRKQNAAGPLGERTEDPGKVRKTGKREARSAGPDGPRAEDVGRTFKEPGAPRSR
jgi:hypothetical protein